MSPSCRLAAFAASGAIAALAVATSVGDARAAPLDFRFDKFAETAQAGSKIHSEPMRILMREISFALGARSIGPLASQGSLGVDFAYEMSVAGAHSSESYWKKAVAAPAESLTTHGVRFRKGVPHTVQLGTHLTHLADSSLYAAGLEIAVAPIDGFRNLPDFGVRASATGMFGSSHVENFVNASVDAGLSKSFGIGGVLALQPWVGYSAALTYFKPLAAKVIPDERTMQETMPEYTYEIMYSQRAAFGLRVVSHRVQAGVELVRSFTDSLNLVTTRIGAVF